MGMKSALLMSTMLLGLSQEFSSPQKGFRSSSPSEETLRKREERKRKKKHTKQWKKK